MRRSVDIYVLYTMRNWWLISNKKGIAQAVPPFVFERIEKCAWVVLRNEL